MDLENLFVSDLLDTLVGATDDRSTTLAIGEEGEEPEPLSTTQALGEEGDEPEPPQDTVIEPEPIVTSDAVGEEGDAPECYEEGEPDPIVTSDAVGEEGDQPEDTWEAPEESEPEGFDPPLEEGIWAGEDGNGGGCVIEEDDPEPEPVVEEVDTWWPCDEVDPDVPVESEPVAEPAGAPDGGTEGCW